MLLGAAVLALGALGAPAASAQGSRTAVVAFIPTGAAQLARQPGMSVGIMSGAQGSYSAAQLLLDITQGARVSSSAYRIPGPPALTIQPSGTGAVVTDWGAAVARASSAPATLVPGLLAGSIPGGGAYAGTSAAAALDAPAAADRSGRIASLSLGSAGSLAARVAALGAVSGLVVTDLPAGPAGAAALEQLSAHRGPGELLIVVQRAGPGPGGALLWTGAAGLPGAGGRELSSQSTGERGLISSVDVAPTILTHLAIGVPGAMNGRAITAGGTLDSTSLASLMSRLRVISSRKLAALGWLLCAWALLLLAARGPAARAAAMRIGALAIMWAPVSVLVPAAIAPSAPGEYALIVVCCLALGALTDVLIGWPRAVLAPAVAAVVAITIDALAHTQLLMRSLLGPDPILGARFYGVGNELKSGLAVLVLAAVAAALYPAVRGSRAVLAMVGAGAVLAVVEGAARIGAGVGGVILVCVSFALAAAMLAPGALTRRRAILIIAAPLAGLIALAAIDLLTAHGSGHYTGSVLHAHSAGEIRDLLVRRYRAAWIELGNHAMPVAAALSLAAGVIFLLRRRELLAPVRMDPAWEAALLGSLAAGVVGALVEDSGPVLLVVALFTLGSVLAYLAGAPRAARRSPGMPPGSRSRALRQPAARGH